MVASVNVAEPASDLDLIAFTGLQPGQRDSFVLSNLNKQTGLNARITIDGLTCASTGSTRTSSCSFDAVRTNAGDEDYVALGTFSLNRGGVLAYFAPPNSVTTFFSCGA